MTLRPSRVWLAAAVCCAACGGGSPTAPANGTSPSGTGQPVQTGLHFTVSPIDISSIVYITSLGAMAPWGHTLPTDHAYVYHQAGSAPAAPVPVYAPAAGQITNISNGRIDVRANAVFSYWLGPVELAGGIATGVSVQAGALLGTHGTFPAIDFSVLRATQNLNFINPLRYSPDTLMADGPMQYFDEPVRSALLPKVLRSGGAIDGRIDYDVADSLAGNWFAADLPVADSGRGGDMFSGTRKLAFARDVYSPDRQRVSIGGLGMTGLYGTSDDAPDFTSVTVASGFVVFRLLAVGAPQAPPTTLQAGWLLVQLLDSQHLRIEAVSLPALVEISAAGPAPAAFGTQAETYLR